MISCRKIVQIIVNKNILSFVLCWLVFLLILLKN